MDTGAVTRFLRRNFFVAKKEGPVVRVEVLHLGASPTRRNSPPTWDRNFTPNEQVDESTIDRMVDDMDKDTQDESDQLDGVQQYVIYIYKETSGDRPVARWPFRQTGECEQPTDEAATPSEPGNLSGAFMQQMRHNEALVRTSVGGWSQMMQTMQKTLARQSDQIEELLRQRIDMYTKVESAESQVHLRQVEDDERKAREKRQDQMIETFLPLVPAVLNMMTGRKLLPEKTTPERMMVTKFMETITPEQFAQMRQLLEPEAYGIVATMLSDIQAGIDSNLPALFKRLLNSLPEQTATKLQTEIFNMGQVASIRTMIESFARSEAVASQERKQLADAKLAEAKVETVVSPSAAVVVPPPVVKPKRPKSVARKE